MRRRRPKPEKVRAVSLPDLVSREIGEEVVRLRRAMHRATTQIDAGTPEIARATLQDALQEPWGYRDLSAG